MGKGNNSREWVRNVMSFVVLFTVESVGKGNNSKEWVQNVMACVRDSMLI